MEHKPIHKEGPTFSRIISGAWRWKLEESKIEQLVQASLDSGITTFDHADIYGDHSNEEIFGKIMSDGEFRKLAVEHLLHKVYNALKLPEAVKNANDR